MKKIPLIKRGLIEAGIIVFVILVFCPISEALPVSVFNSGWTLITDDEGHTSGPGGGGQAFDAEYLFYKKEGHIFYFGLQSGFNLELGEQIYPGDNKHYFAGDLSISVGDVSIGDPSTYEYAIDFGFSGIDTPLRGTKGLYEVAEWEDAIYSQHSISNPYAMKSGSQIGDVITSAGKEGDSYFRIVSFDIFDIPEIVNGETFTLSLNWTESCGNDNINGEITETVRVPEPATLLLFGYGLAGCVVHRKRKRS